MIARGRPVRPAPAGRTPMYPVECSGMRLLGQHDLGGRGNCGEGTALLCRAGRRYLYLAHESGPANFSVVEVTDPAMPRLLTQTTVPHRGVRSNSLAVADDLLIVAYQVSAPGQRPAGIEVFDLGKPAEPRPIGALDLSGPHSRGTHWVGFTGGRYAYLSTGTPDSRPTHPLDDQFPVIVDLSRPDRPAEAGRWWLPGTQAADGCPPPVRHPRFDAGFRAHNVNVYPQRPDRAYVGYLDGGAVILDIADVAAPRLVSRLDYHPPMPGFTHTVLPLFGRDLLAISDETVHDHAADYPKLLWFADASHERSPSTPPGAAGSGRTTCTRTSRSTGPGGARTSCSAPSSTPACGPMTCATRSSPGRWRRSCRPPRPARRRARSRSTTSTSALTASCTRRTAAAAGSTSSSSRASAERRRPVPQPGPRGLEISDAVAGSGVRQRARPSLVSRRRPAPGPFPLTWAARG